MSIVVRDFMDILLFINIDKKQNIESVHTTYCNP